MINLTDKLNLAYAAVKLWQGDENSIEFVSDSTNYVFSFIKKGRKYFLRLIPENERTKNQIVAELDFIDYLYQNGVNAALPIPSISANLIEEINSSECSLVACVFEEAKGEHFKYDSADFNQEHFRLRGRTLGQIHALSRNYIPSGDFRRFAWNEDRLLIEVNKILSKTETIVWQEFLKVKIWLENYPQSGETFGLIHGDFGETNYRFQNNQLNIFDFDDCCYHWFLYDLAITIYPHGWRKEGLQLLDWLLEGYSEKMNLNIRLADITMFCQWRLIYMFLVYARKWGFKDLTTQQSEWFAQKRENIRRSYQWQIS